MFLKRFFEPTLAQVSYLIGCPATGEAIVIDPNRAVDQYVKADEPEHARITHVTETHIHADFGGGTRALAAGTGATMYLSGEGGSDWAYRFGDPGRVVSIRHGDRV